MEVAAAVGLAGVAVETAGNVGVLVGVGVAVGFEPHPINNVLYASTTNWATSNEPRTIDVRLQSIEVLSS